jgi:hypothetical protein
MDGAAFGPGQGLIRELDCVRKLARYWVLEKHDSVIMFG